MTKAWLEQSEQGGKWVVWGTQDPDRAEAAMYNHLVDDLAMDFEGYEFWAVLPAWSAMRDGSTVRRLWADRDLIDLHGTWPRWKFGRWRPFRVRVLQVFL